MSLNLPREYIQLISDTNKCLNANLEPQTCDYRKNIFKKAVYSNPKEFIIVNDSQTLCLRENLFRPINPYCRVFNTDNLGNVKMDYDYLTKSVDGLIKPEGMIKFTSKDEAEKIRPYEAKESGIRIGDGKVKNISYSQLAVKPSDTKYELGSLLQK